jgi:hypothetical protein
MFFFFFKLLLLFVRGGTSLYRKIFNLVRSRLGAKRINHYTDPDPQKITTSVADRGPEIRSFFDLWIRDRKKCRSRIRDPGRTSRILFLRTIN